MASKKKSPGKAGAKPTRKSPSKRSTAGGKRKKATGSSGSNPLMTDTTFPITAEWEGKPPVKKNSMTVVKLGTKLVPLYSKSYREALANQLPQVEKSIGGLLAGSKETPIWVEFKFYTAKGQEPDLDNLITAGADLLQKAKTIANDRWVKSYDGSRSYYKLDEDGNKIETNKTKVTIRRFEA